MIHGLVLYAYRLLALVVSHYKQIVQSAIEAIFVSYVIALDCFHLQDIWV